MVKVSGSVQVPGRGISLGVVGDSCLAEAWEETGVWEETEAWKGQGPVRVQKPRGFRDMGRV